MKTKLSPFEQRKELVIAEWETKIVREALIKHRGKMKVTAAYLGLAAPALRRKLKRLGIKSIDYRLAGQKVRKTEVFMKKEK